MKKNHVFWRKSFGIILVLLLTHIYTIARAAPTYIQLNSGNSQLMGAHNVNTPTVIQLKDPVSIANMSWDKTKNTVTILEDGIYMIAAGVQCGIREFFSLDPAGGDIYFWIEANGAPMPDSGEWTHVSPEARSKYLIDFLAMHFTKGTVLRFMLLTTVKNIGLVTFHGTEVRPDSPGFQVSMWKVNDFNLPLKR